MATMPIDVKSVLEEALSFQDAASTPVSVSVFLDDLAPEDVVACVRNAFASAASHARITLSYLGSSQAVPNPDDDLSVIVAGLNPQVGALAADLRQAGVPTMVVTSLPQYVINLAAEQGYPLPEGDVVAPAGVAERPSAVSEMVDSWWGEGSAPAGADAPAPEAAKAKAAPSAPEKSTQEQVAALEQELAVENAEAGQAATGNDTAAEQGKGFGKLIGNLASAAKAKVSAVQEAAVSGAVQKEAPKTTAEIIAEAMPEGSPEPYAMTEEHIAALHKRMGEWIIDTCRSKKMALALAFPFVRKPLALEAVNMTSVQNAGIGAVVFIPGADMPLMTLNQAKMLLQIAAAYGQAMTIERAKELAVLVAGAFASRTVARELVGLVPFAGFAIKAGIGYSATLAMGRTAIEYFEGGGGAAGLASLVGKATDTATTMVGTVVDMAADEPVADKRTGGQKAADTAKAFGSRFGKTAAAMAGAAVPYAQAAAKTGLTSFVSGAAATLKNAGK